MRILFLNYEYPPLGGGAANATAYILEEFAVLQNVHVDLVTSSIDETYHKEVLGESVIIHRLPIGKNPKNLHYQSMKELFVYSWRAYMFSRGLLQKEKYTVIQAFFTVPCGLVAWKLRREFSVPFIVSLRGSDVPGYSSRFTWLYPFIRPFVKRIWRNAVAVISNSQGLKELALQTNPHQAIDIIPNGVDIRHFAPKLLDDALVRQRVAPLAITLGASRVTDRKGIDYLVDALDMLRDSHSFTLTIIGDGDARLRLEEKVKALHLESTVSFAGRVPRYETLRYYQEADIFVLPSLNEGMSNAMLEALACGLPLITTRTGGAEELVEDGVNGVLIESKSAASIAKALTLLAQNPQLRLDMGRKSREKAERMSWKHVALQYHDIYTRYE